MGTYKLDYENPYKRSHIHYRPNEYLLAGGGPVNFSERVLKAMANQCVPPLADDTHKMMADIRQYGHYIYQTKNDYTMAIQVSGNGGNEALVVNLTDPGDRMIVAIGGYWGELVVDMGQRNKCEVIPLRKGPGEIYTLEELEDAVKKYKPAVLFVTHGESTGSTIQYLEGLGPMCHKYNCLLAVDATVSAAVIPLFVDRWKVDAVAAGVQKGLGAPAGLSLISLSPRAVAKMEAKKDLPPFYYDLKELKKYWDPSIRKYRYTYSSNNLCALRESLSEICEEGLENVWARHKASAELFWKELETINLSPFVKKRENRFYGVTCVLYPSDIEEKAFLKYLKEKHAIDITPGYGPTLNKAMRVGLMNQNSRPEVVKYLIEAFKDGLEYFRRNQSNNGLKI